MKEARLEVAIASWFGTQTREDTTLRNIITSFMGRTDNPYPNLRWALYYEDEGFADPSVSTLVTDLNYIKNSKKWLFLFALKTLPCRKKKQQIQGISTIFRIYL